MEILGLGKEGFENVSNGRSIDFVLSSEIPPQAPIRNAAPARPAPGPSHVPAQDHACVPWHQPRPQVRHDQGEPNAWVAKGARGSSGRGVVSGDAVVAAVAVVAAAQSVEE